LVAAEGGAGGRETDAVSWEMVEKEERMRSRESARGEVWAFICRRNKRRNISCMLWEEEISRSDLLDSIRSSDELMVMVVNQSVTFAVEETDLRVEVVLLFDEL